MLRVFLIVALLIVALGSGCAGPPPDFTGSDPDSVFQAVVMPVLADQCGDCHFPGGPMHRAMPFDDQAFVRTLEDELVNGLEGRGRAEVAAWLDLIADDLWAPDTVRSRR